MRVQGGAKQAIRATRNARASRPLAPPRGPLRDHSEASAKTFLLVLCVKFCKGGRGRAGLGGLAEVGFLVLLKIVHVEVAVGFEPVFVGLDG
jgi:hypothetical protein